MLNTCHLIGRVGRDPEIRMTTNGTKQAKFSLATTERFKNKQTGEQSERTDWHNIVAWRFTADLVERLQITKGTLLHVEGKVRNRSWDGPDGQKRHATDIEISSFNILSPKGQNTQSQPSSNNQQAGEYNPQDDDYPF